MPIIPTTLNYYCARTALRTTHTNDKNTSTKRHTIARRSQTNERKKNVFYYYSNYCSVRWRSVRESVCVWLRTAENRINFYLHFLCSLHLIKYILRSKSFWCMRLREAYIHRKTVVTDNAERTTQRQAWTPLTLIENDWHHKCKSTIYAIRMHTDTHTVVVGNAMHWCIRNGWLNADKKRIRINDFKRFY